MRLFIIILFVISFSGLQAQDYESVHIEKGRNPDIDNTIFKTGRGFLYQLSIYESGDEKQLVFSDTDWDFEEISQESSKGQVNSIIYLTASVNRSKRINKKQTEVIIGFEPQGKTFQNTGIVENAQNIWLHPPRSNFFKILELCPFPYVKFSSADLKWQDKIKIDQKWQDSRWATWEGDQTIDLIYANKGFKNIASHLGEFRCLITKSTAKSTFGESILTTYFNSEVGFVKMEYEILGRYTVLLELVEIKEFGEILSPEDYLIKKRR
ncbi:hypothetical protein QYS48_29915 [Marivirga arenosa]|uniref:Uncharacterized protein n=1 Tax=Marivirga arenosa TaxID=3059076 RepID=A0AA51NB07_9BACT|nr:hypothetical protein [Marivirga sp. ABR2-2]WMN07800.1 hypothetical protein QYS48_29915 [Marivirga sp. ABR2-2]